jgi:branched-chain amino acid transport system permease protein
MIGLVTQIFFDALLLIGLYAIGSLGFSLIWGVLNILNLAYGALIAIGGYTTYLLWQAGMDPILALPFSMAVTALIGWVIQWLTIDHILRGPPSLSLTLTYGVNLVMIGALLLIFSGDVRGIQVPEYLQGNVQVGDATLTYARIVVMVIALALTGALWWFMDRTELGMAIRATRLDTEAAQLVGIRIRSIYHLTAALSAMLAGATGGLAALVYTISPQMGDHLLISLLIVNVLGGLGSIVAPLAGAVVLGFTNSAVGNFYGATYSTLVGMVFVLLVLFARPSGLMGKKFYDE